MKRTLDIFAAAAASGLDDCRSALPDWPEMSSLIPKRKKRSRARSRTASGFDVEDLVITQRLALKMVEVPCAGRMSKARSVPSSSVKGSFDPGDCPPWRQDVGAHPRSAFESGVTFHASARQELMVSSIKAVSFTKCAREAIGTTAALEESSHDAAYSGNSPPVSSGHLRPTVPALTQTSESTAVRIGTERQFFRKRQ
jgi:hypothetical protein